MKKHELQKKPRESVMEANNTVVGSDNEESVEDWSVVFNLPRTKLVYSEQHLAERWDDKKDKSMVESNWAFNRQPIRNVEQNDWIDKAGESVVDSRRVLAQPIAIFGSQTIIFNFTLRVSRQLIAYF